MKFVLTINCDNFTNVPRDLATQLRERANEIERRSEDMTADHAFVIRDPRNNDYLGFFILTDNDNHVNKLQDFDRTVLRARQGSMFKRG